MGDADKWGRLHMCQAGGVYQKSLPLLLSFAVNLNVLLRRKSIKQSKTRYVFKAQTFLLSLRLTKALFGDRMRRGWGRWALA